MLPDGDRLLGCLHTHPEGDRPLVIHLHGLEGCADSHYQVGLSAKAFAAGMHSLRLNFRTCGGTEHLAKRFYHGRRTEDLAEVVRQLADQGFGPIYVTGASLGGNLLLRWLADTGNQAPIAGAIAVSPPIDMASPDIRYWQGINRIYERYFLKSLQRRLRRSLRHWRSDELSVLVAGLNRLKTLRDFDDTVTAPLNGYSGADDYYRHVSSVNDLDCIAVPTLIIHAQDDPIVPFEMFRARSEMLTRHPMIRTIFPEHGGHVGFISDRKGPLPWMDGRWAENEAIAFLASLSP